MDQDMEAFHNAAHQRTLSRLDRHEEALRAAGLLPATEPASSLSSVPSPGPATKPSASSSAMPAAPTVSLREDRERLVLTVETGDCFNSTWYTWPEWEAIRIFCSTQPSMSEWLTQSGSSKVGDPGVAVHNLCPECGHFHRTSLCSVCYCRHDYFVHGEQQRPIEVGYR